MKLNIFIFKNNYLECTGQPVWDDHEPDAFAKGQERALMTKEPEKVIPFENVDLYYLGSYDDETMKFNLKDEPLLLLRCSDVITKRKGRSKVFDDALAQAEADRKEGDSNGDTD